MSIEDLDYLYENSVKENVIILVDSAKRNKDYWLEPNEFQIDFVEPFKYVYGVEILDLNIPRTVYGIDSQNNTLLIYKLDIDGHFKPTTVIIESRDYTIGELIIVLNSQLRILKIECKISLESASDENRKSILEFTVTKDVDDDDEDVNEDNPKPFYIDIKGSSMGTTLGFDSISQKEYNDWYTKLPSNPFLHGSNKNSFAITNKDVLVDNKHVFGCIPMSPTITTKELVDIQDLNMSETGYVTKIQDLNMSETGYVTKIQAISDTASSSSIEIEFYQEDVLKYEITLDNTRPNEYIFELDTSNTAYIFDVLNISGSGWSIQSNTVLTDVRLTIYDFKKLTLISPGIVTLLGDRYVTIHCDEIENHLKGSMMYNTYSPGLALVNLGVLGYSQTRVDFYSVNYKEFHPLGKLTNLKISVRNPYGKLYNFRNVNWHMLMCIKFYVPKQKKMFKQSVLNPNYNLNYVQYQIEKDGIRTRELQDETDSETEEELDPLRLRYTLSKREEALRRQNDNDSDSSYESDA